MINNTSPALAPIAPSSWKLEQMIANAEAKFDAARLRAELAREERNNERVARGLARAARGRYYDSIQRGFGIA